MSKPLAIFICVASVLALASCQTSERVDRGTIESRSIEIVREFSRALNNVDYDVFKASLKEGAVWHYRGRTIDWTPESERSIQSAWKQAFPDHQYRIDLMFAKWDTVTVLYTYTGTHSDTIMGIAPTGNSIAVPEMVIFRIEEDRIAEQWVVFDEYLLRRQLGAD